MLPLAIAGAGLALGGGALGAYGAYSEGLFQKGVHDFNSRQLRIDATIAEQNAQEQARRLRMGGRRLLGQQRVAVARSGFRMEGTPLDVIAQSMENIELDAINTRQQGQFQAAQMRTQADWEEKMGKYAKKAGTIGGIGGLVSGAAKALSFGV